MSFKNPTASQNSNIKAVLIDLSGTVHISNAAIPGAIEACRKLHNLNKIPIRFVTNTTKLSSSSLLKQLRNIGFDEAAIPNIDSIITSTKAARKLLMQRQLRPMYLVENDLMKDLEGVSGFDDDKTTGDEYDPNCVLIGLATNDFCYNRLNEAFRVLMKITREMQEVEKEDKESNNSSESKSYSPLIAIHRAKYYRDRDGGLSLGPGGFVSLLEEATDLKAEVIGKPSRSFFDSIISELGVVARDVVMIGDDVTQDIRGALDAGIGHAILVKTGKFLPGDEDKIPIVTSNTTTTKVVNSIVDAVEYICSTGSIL